MYKLKKQDRRVIRHGDSLVMTLPAMWVREQGIRAGDELRVEAGEGLVVSLLGHEEKHPNPIT